MDRNWIDLFILGYSIAIGFVTSGIVSSFYQMLTAKPVRFGMFGASYLAWLVTFLFFALTGPFVVVSAGIRSYRVEKRPVQWLIGAVVIAALWSCCSGIVVLGVAVSARMT